MMRFPSQEIVARLRESYPKGTWVELVCMDDAYTALHPGDKGRVDFVDDGGTIHITWNNGSTLGAVYGVDQVRKISGEKEQAPVAEVPVPKRPAGKKPGRGRGSGR